MGFHAPLSIYKIRYTYGYLYSQDEFWKQALRLTNTSNRALPLQDNVLILQHYFI